MYLPYVLLLLLKTVVIVKLTLSKKTKIIDFETKRDP